MRYHYYDLVEERHCSSDVQLLSNGLRRVAVLEELDKPDHSANRNALLLHDLSASIGKQQRKMITDDREQMWRYWNNAQVAQEVLAGTADAETLAEFEGMLAENKLSDPDYYGGMTVQMFAEWLLGLNREFKLLGLRLETERIRRRRLLQADL